MRTLRLIISKSGQIGKYGSKKEVRLQLSRLDEKFNEGDEAFRRFFLPGRQLYTLLYFRIEICLFCTQKQVSTHQFTQFHKVTKISIAISASFVYNVTIRVPAPQMEGFPSRKEY